jgi:uncharacterized phage protein gp47/JayE
MWSFKIKTVGNAVVIRWDRGEGTVDVIIAVNYPKLTAAEIVSVKEYIAAPTGANRPDVTAEQYQEITGDPYSV